MPITWRNISAPSVSSTSSAGVNGANLLNQGISLFNNSVNQYYGNKEKEATDAFKTKLLSATSPEELNQLAHAMPTNGVNADELAKTYNTKYDSFIKQSQLANDKKKTDANIRLTDARIQDIQHDNSIQDKTLPTTLAANKARIAASNAAANYNNQLSNQIVTKQQKQLERENSLKQLGTLATQYNTISDFKDAAAKQNISPEYVSEYLKINNLDPESKAKQQRNALENKKNVIAVKESLIDSSWAPLEEKAKQIGFDNSFSNKFTNTNNISTIKSLHRSLIDMGVPVGVAQSLLLKDMERQGNKIGITDHFSAEDFFKHNQKEVDIAVAKSKLKK